MSQMLHTNVVQLYDRIASVYSNDKFDLYKKCHLAAGEQLLQFSTDVKNSIDLAVGTGDFWVRFLEMSNAFESMHLNDVSKAMLAKAKLKLGTSPNYSSHTLPEMADLFPENSFDLVCCHFIFSYVKRLETYQIAKKLLRPGGLFSILSSTQQNLLEVYDTPIGWTGKAMGVPAAVAKTQTPVNHQVFVDELKAQGFSVLSAKHLRPEVEFRNRQDVIEWAFDSGWGLEFFSGPTTLIRMMADDLLRIANVTGKLYPFAACMDFSVILVAKQ